MSKIIHYCWFGEKPLPKLAKKCIKSWEKYLPDYKIMIWTEKNVNFNECAFIKGAYENKKWAFVADYVRAKVLKEYGGIYFDTDMEIIKDISPLLSENTTFLGIEDSGYIAVGVWYEKNKEAFLPNELLKKYKSIKKFEIDNMTEVTIPKMISNILNKYGFKHSSNNVQELQNDIVIYPRDYFYPYSYYWDEKIVTQNTYMIHYYDASWLPIKPKIELALVRRFGKKNGYRIINLIRRTKQLLRKCIKLCIFPYIIYRRWKRNRPPINEKYKVKINLVKKRIAKCNQKEYITFYNSNWKGVSSSTKELFNNLISLPEIYRKKDAKMIAKTIVQANIKQVVFSSFAYGWKYIAIYLKKFNKNIKIKTFWHGSHSQILDLYGWSRNQEIIMLHKSGIVDVMGTCKKSLVNFYKNQGFNIKFITNKVEVKKTTKINNLIKEKETVKIGLYAARCTDWRKNMYSQIAAAAQIPNAIVDIVPLDETAKKFAKLLSLKVTGETKNLSREKLMQRMSENDVNMYVSFSECAPMVPLESLEMNVPCIIGNNCHYFKDSQLEEDLVINNETSVLEIAQKIKHVIDNKDSIINMYKEFRKENLQEQKRQVEDFLQC